MTSALLSRVTSEFGGRLVHVITSGLLLILLTRLLGPDGYGLLALAISVFTVSRFLSESGLHWSAAKYVAEFKAERPDAAATVVVESRRLVLAAATVVAVGLAATADRIAAVLAEPALSTLLVAGAGVVFWYSLHRYNRHILQGYEAIGRSAALHAFEGVATLALVAGLVLYRPTPLTAVFGYAAAYAVAALAGFVAVSHTGDLGSAVLTERASIRRKVLRYNLPLSATRLSNVVDNEADVLLIAYFTTPIGVAFYALGLRIAEFVRTPAASIGFALSPTYGSEKSSGSVEHATAVFEESLSKTLVLYVPACAGIIVIAETAIPVVFGADYTGAVVVVQVLALFVFFDALLKITGPGLDYLGRARARAIVNAVTSASNIVLNVLFIPTFGVVGAAYATVITTGCYSLLSLGIMYTELAFDLRRIGNCFVLISAIALLMSLVVVAFTAYLSGAVAMVGGIAIGVGTWLVACHLFDLLNVTRLVELRHG
ncbi:oligosaccharide flippase family protein [Natronococcus sp. A-GB1]|uniref:oligosaccharide flippase family protein n=1 Tax=Natronococcus sp. A-GB1 TaxID=3037648 RepID=UPI00241CFC72|nr:polysaccharide biosynthesis C-terminal domain-containing protein [Natronococcus sp. A-GB1]MDG5761818.1 oligosaccharide flippase family protein [Natronococcus sp. A-GB1]